MQETLSYESYIRMNRYLLETEKLYEQIQFLVEHHVEDILILYEKLDDAERLLEVLREFLIN
ncbi:MAG: hypothetical protein H6767_01945 [Candidatus Peribacteria bacterium]|nr:MAG: hypothetical protein H6767_01945 [Candidatus Peribacteria bacterium]